MDTLKTSEEIRKIQDNPTCSVENNEQTAFIDVYNY